MANIPLAEFIFDKAVEYLQPTMSCLVLQAMDDLQSAQNPPYSRGLFFMQIRNKFSTYKISTKLLMDVLEPVFTSLAKLNQFYCDKEFARFSMRRIDDSWYTWDELLSKKFPGYYLDDSQIICNKSDVTIDLDELIGLFRSKDIARYNEVKQHFFGSQARYTN